MGSEMCIRDRQEGAMIESTKGGKEPIDLGNGERRTFLADGDRVIMRAWCEQEGKRRIGLGSLTSTVLPRTPQLF